MKSRKPDTHAPAMKAALLTAPKHISKHEDTPAQAIARAKKDGAQTPMQAALLRAMK